MEQKVSGAKGRQQQSHFSRSYKAPRMIFQSSDWVFTLSLSELEIETFPLSRGLEATCRAELMQEGPVFKRWEWVRPISVCYRRLAAALGRLFLDWGTNHPSTLQLKQLLEKAAVPTHYNNKSSLIYYNSFFFLFVMFCFASFFDKVYRLIKVSAPVAASRRGEKKGESRREFSTIWAASQ